MRNKKGFKNLPIRPIRTAIKVTQSNFILIQFFVTLLTFYLLLEEHVAPIRSESNSRKFKHLPTKCVTVTQQQHCRSCRGSSSALFVLFFFQSFLKWIQLDWQHCVNHFHIERTRIFYNEGGPFVTSTQDVEEQSITKFSLALTCEFHLTKGCLPGCLMLTQRTRMLPTCQNCFWPYNFYIQTLLNE